MPETRIPLVIDTDTAADDCFALLVGLLDPRADLRAVTVVGGNVDFDQQVHNALLTIDLAGRGGEVPVHLGARNPLEREWVGAAEVHGDGVGGLRRTDTTGEPSAEPAVDALLRLAAELEGELRIVAIGPLTNLAMAVRRDPAFASKVRSLTVMGGSVNGRGNITPAAEYNVYVDPEAAAIVAAAGFPDLVIMPWDPVTIRDLVFDRERIDRIAELASPLGDFFVRANQATFDFDLAEGLAGSSHPDSFSVAMTLDPGLVLEERGYLLEVETLSDLTRGATVFDWRAPIRNCRAVLRADGDRFFALMHSLLGSRS